MFVRYKCIKSSNGSVYTYAYLVENIWITDKQTARQKVIKYIGKVSNLLPFEAKKIFQRDKFICQYCGSKEKLTIDHIFPLSKGGNNDDKNLQVLCLKCNQKKAIFMMPNFILKGVDN
jgi:5-methylcytosine-specific restriction endonuclease McrA